MQKKQKNSTTIVCKVANNQSCLPYFLNSNAHVLLVSSELLAGVVFEGAVYLTRTELDEGRSQEAVDNFFAQSHYTDSPQTKLFYSAHYVRFIE